MIEELLNIDDVAYVKVKEDTIMLGINVPHNDEFMDSMEYLLEAKKIVGTEYRVGVCRA